MTNFLEGIMPGLGGGEQTLFVVSVLLFLIATIFLAVLARAER